MTRKGRSPNDYRSEAERVHARPDVPSFDPTGSRAGRAPEYVTPHGGVRYGPEAPPNSDEENPDKVQRRAIVELLSEEPEFSTSDVTVEVQGGVVVLSGSVDTINTKYRAEEISKRVAGITSVNNQLTVRVGNAMDEHMRGSAASRIHDQSSRTP
jgi:HSP20 family molecular chaperone IbpA